MSAQSVGLGSMFGWVTGAFGLIRGNFVGLMMASLVTLGVLLLMFAPMVIAMAVLMPAAMAAGSQGQAMPAAGMMPLLLGYGVMILMFFFLFPPLMIGWFRLCQAADRGTPVRALDLLRPYADGQLWLRAMGFALLALLAYLAVFALLGLAFSDVFVTVMQQVAAEQAAALSGQEAPASSLPAGFFLGYCLVMVLSLLLQVAYMLGFAEIALRPATAWEAIKTAGAGTGRNAPKLLLFFLCMLVLMIVGVLVLGLVFALVIGGLSLVSPWLSVAVAVLMYIPVLLLMYPLMFAGHYLAWKSILGGDQPVGDADGHEVGALAA